MVTLMHGEDGTTYKDVVSATIIVDGLEVMVQVGIQVFGKYMVARFGAVDGLALTKPILRRELSKRLNCGIQTGRQFNKCTCEMRSPSGGSMAPGVPMDSPNEMPRLEWRRSNGALQRFQWRL